MPTPPLTFLINADSQVYQLACDITGALYTNFAVPTISPITGFQINDTNVAQSYTLRVLTPGEITSDSFAGELYAESITYSGAYPTVYYVGGELNQVFALQIIDGILTTTLHVTGLYNFNYIKSFPLSNQSQYTVALDAGGFLWTENVVTSPHVLKPLTVSIIPGTYMLSTTMDDVEYMCFSNLSYGTDIPRQYNPQPANGSLPSNTGGTVTPNIFDMLDWMLMSPSLRSANHLAGTKLDLTTPSNHIYTQLNSGNFYWIKGDSGWPWDINIFDNDLIYLSTTENGWTAPTMGKRFESLNPSIGYKGVPFAKRFMNSGESVFSSDTRFGIYTACGTATYSNLGNAKCTLSGPFTETIPGAGGNLPANLLTLHIEYEWSLDSSYNRKSGTVKETYTLARPYGLIQWQTQNWNVGLGAYDAPSDATNYNILTSGVTGLPFDDPCGFGIDITPPPATLSVNGKNVVLIPSNYTLDRISQVGPGAPPTFASTQTVGSNSITITSWAGASGIVTFQGVNTLTAGDVINLSGFATSTFFNGKTFSVLGTGLSGTQFEVAFSGFSGGTDTGLATPQYGYTVHSITQNPQKSDPGDSGHFQALLWSNGPGSRSNGNVITVYYANASAFGPDSVLTNQFNAGIPCYVYISGAPFGNGTQLITAIGSGVPPGGSGARWFFTFQSASSNYQFFGGPDDASGFYQLSIATLTVNNPIPNISVGDQLTITGASPGGWNATWTVIKTPNSGQYLITQTSQSGSIATYNWSWAGTGSPIAPVAGQLVTVIQTLNNNGAFNVAEAPIATVTGGPSSGTFTINNFPVQTVPAVPENGQAVTSGTVFQFDPGQTTLGTTTSPIYGNATVNQGIVTIVGAHNAIGAGTRQAVVFFETRNGLKTACSAPITFTTVSTATYILASNIPLGPPNVIRRWIAFTGAGPNGIAGPNFYTIDTPISYTINNQTYLYTPTYIDDNVTTTAKFTFTDAVLLAGDEIDVQGNDLFNQIELGSSAWNIAYAGRMLYGLEQNKVLNFTNLSFDGGYLPNSGGVLSPLGWSLDPSSNFQNISSATITATQIFLWPASTRVGIVANNNFTVGMNVTLSGLTTATYLNGVTVTIDSVSSTFFSAPFHYFANVPFTADTGTATPAALGFAPGTLVVSPVFGNAYYINNQTGGLISTFAMITQNAYQDAYNVPIILPNTLYSVRVTARIPSGKTVGNLIVDLTDSNAGAVSGTGTLTNYGITYGRFVLPLASMSESDNIYTGTLLTTPFLNGVPPGLLLRLWAQNIGIGGDVEIDRLEIFPTKTPTLTTNIRCSYIDNFEAFDAVTGNIGLAAHNTQQANGAFLLHDQLYFLKSGSMESTQDVAGVEPSGWSVHEVSNRVGTCGIHAYDYGEEWEVSACRNGVYGFNGGQPIRIDYLTKEIWEAINWSAGKSIWLRNDLPNRRILCGIPLPTPNQWLPLAPLNAAPTSPNVMLVWDYQGLDTFEELVSGRGMHTTMFGNLVSTDMRVKATIWNITSPYAGFITQPDLTTQRLMICNGVGNEKIYGLDPTALNDDGVAINSRYFTYGFVDSAKASQFPLLGFHRKTFNGLQILSKGAGQFTIQAYPNFVLTNSSLTFNPRVYTVPPYALSEQPTDDYWRPLNVTGNRIFFSFGSNSLTSRWDVSKFTAVGVMAPFGAVNPNVG